jgi:hypothetical protein
MAVKNREWDMSGLNLHINKLFVGGLKPGSTGTQVAGVGVADTVTIGVAAGATNSIDWTITVKDINGNTVAGVYDLELYIAEQADGTGGLTGDTYSGNVTASTGTILTALTAKKHIIATTASTGILVINAVASAKPADQYLVVKKPSGAGVVVSAASGTNWGA